jgi:hypothetical protein
MKPPRKDRPDEAHLVDRARSSDSPRRAGRSQTSDRRRGRRRLRRSIAAGTLALLALPGVSYAQALTAPGDATFQVRTVDWIRDHGGTPAVNTLENWYYTLRAPSNGPPSADTVPATRPADGSTAGTAVASGPSTALPLLKDAARLPGEATWFPVRAVNRAPAAVYTGYFRPDPSHPSIVAGVAWMRSGSTRAHLVAGTVQPGGRFPGNAAIPAADLPNLAATFNSGWRMKDIPGGFYLQGRTAKPLVDGQATGAIDDRGHLTVGRWGRDLTLNRHLVAARQNLQLIVDQGHPVPGLDANADGQWGSPKNQFQYTARSALGTDPSGNVVYVAGKNMNLHTLATALSDAGAVRGMELDIHNGMQSFASWRPGPQGTPTPTKLLPTMTSGADRYVSPDQRDFFYLTVSDTRRPPARTPSSLG